MSYWRGVSKDEAARRWTTGIAEIAQVEAAHLADDEAFWRRAPQLSGDWPASWLYCITWRVL